MNRILSLTLALGVFFVFTGATFAQLPPTLHRITPVDTAVDAPVQAQKLAPSWAEPFGMALRASESALTLPVGGALATRPLCASLWARLDSARSYNILLAFEPKNSPRHWELFTMAGSGALALYLPGNPAGDHLISQESFADGQWHRFGVVFQADSAQIYADGKMVAEGKIDRPLTESDPNALLGIGTLAEGGLGCDGLIDEVTVRKGEPDSDFLAETAPQSPSALDDAVLLHLRFDDAVPTASDSASEKTQTAENAENAKKVENSAEHPDHLIAAGNKLAEADDLRSFDTLGLSSTVLSLRVEGSLAEKLGGKVTLSTDRVERLFPTGGMEIDVKPGDHPAKNIPIQACDRAAFDRRASELGLASVQAADFRDGVFSFWGERFVELTRQISGEIPLPKGAADQVFDAETLIADGEKYPVQVVLRRTGDILETLEGAVDSEAELAQLSADWEKLKIAVEENANAQTPNTETLTTDFFLASALCRRGMFLDPTLGALDKILFLARGCYAGCRLTNASNTDRIGGHFATQVYGFNSIHGGGLFTLSGWREKNPTMNNLLAGKKVTPTEVCSRLAGKELDYGSFYAPELSYDGKTVYFSHTGSREHRWIWTPDTTWNIFKLTLDTEDCAETLTQLTDSAYNDFDVCCLPSGRLVFASERRGGFIRCFGEGADLRVTTSVLHSMKPDGSDIYPISFFETSEWQPSVDHNGMLAYTRWDYTDRENCLGSTYWTSAPDGRNPRSPQGNYPQPWFTFPDGAPKIGDKIHGDHRFGRCDDAPSALPMTEMQFRAIPDSHRMIFTAAPHHGETFGSLCMLDLRVPDDNHMARVKRLTPYFPFPESESAARGQYCYGSAWPLSEDLYLCNKWEDLILLDRFGNEELLGERELLPIGYDPRLRLSEPIPLSERPVPPVVPQQTAQGEDYASANQTATIGVINVNIADLPLPPDRPVKRLRVLQVIPKPNPWMNDPDIGYAPENTPRIPLGIVDVDADGSALFEAPYGKQLLFQVLDKDFQAIQTMRAVTYAHPGERLICTGCHEPLEESVQNQQLHPTAFRRAPQKLRAECDFSEPINFYRLIEPTVQKSCVGCHQEKQLKLQNMDYAAFRPYVFFFAGGMHGQLTQPIHGGSRSIPGRCGAAASPLSKILLDENHRETVSDEVRHKFTLWIDANAPRLGAFRDEEAQKRGELVWPILDVETPQK